MQPLLKILQEIRPEHDFTSSTDFIGDGMLDSFDIVALVADLEKAYSISIRGTDILPQNFASLKAIEELLRKSGAAL